MDLGISGLASGFDWRAFIDQISDLERAPQRRLRAEQDKIGQRNIAYGSLVTQLNVLKNRVDVLKETSFFDGRTATVADATSATAAADTTAAVGSYQFNFSQLATTSGQVGTANIGARLNDSSDVDGLLLSDAAFATPVSEGTFTINGKQITIEEGDTLGDVFDQIASVTGNVTATYDEVTDKIQLQVSGGGTVILGSATDTSNFLQVARLYNNGTDTVTSASALGAVQQSANMAEGNFNTAVSNGGAGAGQFKVNGVTISFDASDDTLNDVLARINGSNAGVTAAYDSVNDRVLLTNKTTGDMGISLQDVKGNFLAATGISGGTLNRGKNLEYTVNGGGTLVSLTNTITAASSGISGLTVTALAEGESSVEVKPDSEKIKTALTDFIKEYNKTQSMIDAETTSTTDAKGVVTAGTLAAERDASELATKLRGLVNGVVGGLSGSIKQLAALGIDSNGVNDTIALEDNAALDEALETNLSQVKALFTDSTNGLAVALSSYIDEAAGDDGSLLNLQANLGKQSLGIDTQVEDLERFVQSNKEKLINSFIAMETAQAKINQQLQFLSQRFGS